MRYSLSSRVHGTLLGAAVGEMIGSSTDGRWCLSSSEATQTQSQVKLVAPSVTTADSLWKRSAVLSAGSLIRLGRFDVDDWSRNCGNNLIEQDAINCPSTAAIIATLPIALFYHENEIKLRQNLLALVNIWQKEQVKAATSCLLLRDGALAVGYAIAQSLNEKLNLATLIPQIVAFLGEPQTQMAYQLTQVQTLLAQKAGLERAVITLSRDAQPSNPVALAFYCFLSTLEDFRLSVRRAAKSYQPQITSAITGALSGAYNSTAGIPLNWRLALSQPDAKHLAGWGMTTEAEMLRLSESLVAVWSGVYDYATHPFELTAVAAIAAPRVIRLR